MGRAEGSYPYKSLGAHLRRLREKHRETLADVSGAVEIEVDTLIAIEHGKKRPSEDVLLLLISHFAAREDEASKIWKLAGYDASVTPVTEVSNDESTSDYSPGQNRGPIFYSDKVYVMVNKYGVVIDHLQDTSSGLQPIIAARIGMSREHAQSMITVLQDALKHSETKTDDRSLPKSRNQPSSKPDAKS